MNQASGTCWIIIIIKKRSNTHIIGVPEREVKGCQAEKVFEEIMFETSKIW